MKKLLLLFLLPLVSWGSVGAIDHEHPFISIDITETLSLGCDNEGNTWIEWETEYPVESAELRITLGDTKEVLTLNQTGVATERVYFNFTEDQLEKIESHNVSEFQLVEEDWQSDGKDFVRCYRTVKMADSLLKRDGIGNYRRHFEW